MLNSIKVNNDLAALSKDMTVESVTYLMAAE